MENISVFIVEDDPVYSEMLRYHLALNPDYQVEVFLTGNDCLKNLYRKPAVISIDFSLPDMEGKELLSRIRNYDPDIGVIIVSGQKNINTAVELLKEGAFDYIEKNEDTPARLWNSMRLLIDNISLRNENRKLQEEIGKKYEFSRSIIGSGDWINKLFRLMEKAAGSDISVSISGQTGTGKELVARAIHYNSSRKNKPFIAVNMGAIPRDLIESELFGYEKGAFTGAVSRKRGLFEDAMNGTLLLDEIAELDLNMQTRLLRVLQEKEIRRLGGNQVIKIDVRLITATHMNLAEEVKEGRFRPDLFYRLIGLPIHLPPLSERGNDIIILARHFADEFCKTNKMERAEFTSEAIKKLLSYDYPGNIRELKAVVDQAIVLSDDRKIEPQHLNFVAASSGNNFLSESMSLDDYILRIIEAYISKYENPSKIAEKLGISRATVYRYIKMIKKEGRS
jgi:two-component system, NtrC family, response regulator AtoC